MSDCFDHYIDAIEDNGPGGRGYEEGHGYTDSSASFDYDPLYYHSLVSYKAIKKETEGFSFWCPKSLVQRHKPSVKQLYIHTAFLNTKRENL